MTHYILRKLLAIIKLNQSFMALVLIIYKSIVKEMINFSIIEGFEKVKFHLLSSTNSRIEKFK